MTLDELYVLFEIELAHLIEQGLSMPLIRPSLTSDGEHFPGFDWDTPKPSTHNILCERPFIFNIRKLPKTFYGLEIFTYVPVHARPEEFRPKRNDKPLPVNALNYKPHEDIFEPRKVIAYAHLHAQEIRNQLNDPDFTIKDICDMIVWRDFERHKREHLERELRRSKN